VIRLEDLAEEFSGLYDLDLAAAQQAVSVYTDRMIDDPRLYEFIQGEDEKVSEEGAARLRMQMSEVYGSGSPDADQARHAVRRAVSQTKKYQAQRDIAVRAALALDVPVSALMKDTGLSRARVYQIRDNRR
jgi:hypothetical protein